MGKRLRGVLVLAVLLASGWAALVVGAEEVLATSKELAASLGLPVERTLKVLVLGLVLAVLLALHRPPVSSARGGGQGSRRRYPSGGGHYRRRPPRR